MRAGSGYSKLRKGTSKMSWDTFYKNGWILYCPECRDYLRQSDPQDFSGRKQVCVDDVPCENCDKKHEEDVLKAEEEINEAQALMGRLGIPKETK